MPEVREMSSPGQPPEGVYAHLETLLNAPKLKRSANLSDLLRYLVTRTLQGHADSIKETVVGIEVFGRGADFDGRIDNIVRVQIHRLRKLLEDYYTEEGKNEPLQIHIPKGSYVPIFRSVEQPTKNQAMEDNTPLPPEANGTELNRPVVPLSATLHKRPWARSAVALLLAGFLVGCLATLLLQLGTSRVVASALGTARPTVPAPVAALWKELLDPAANTVVSFTNPVFLRSSSSGLFLLYGGPLSAPSGAVLDMKPSAANGVPDILAKAGPLSFGDGWTGTGEVLAVQKLTALFTLSGLPLRVTRGRALSPDELRTANVIFVGGPWGNPVLERMPMGNHPFLCCDNRTIINTRPQPGEPPTFTVKRDARTEEMSSSYALFSVLPGAQPGRKIVISAGLSTHASAAAVEFVTSEKGAAEILAKLKAAGGATTLPFYQAVIRTDIVRGEAAHPTLSAVRPVQP